MRKEILYLSVVWCSFPHMPASGGCPCFTLCPCQQSPSTQDTELSVRREKNCCLISVFFNWRIERLWGGNESQYVTAEEQFGVREGGHPWNVLIAQPHVWFLSGLWEMMLRSLRQVLLILFLLGEHSHPRYGMCSFPSDWLHSPVFSFMPGKAQFEARAAGRCRLTLLTRR